MTYTRAQWITATFQEAGQPSPSADLVEWGVAWSLFETSNPNAGARYNLLNTIQEEPGSTFFNHLPGGIGVQNFVSFDQGTKANGGVLKQENFAVLHQAIIKNDVSFLKTGEGVNQQLALWGTGPKQAFITSAMGSGLNDPCPGTADPSMPVSGPPEGGYGATYTVVEGDTLSGIAQKTKIAMAHLLGLNLAALDFTARKRGYTSSDNGRWIFPGEVIELGDNPLTRNTYEVQGGDTLAAIALKYNQNPATLYAWNQQILDSAARDHGFASSDNGYWIFPGTEIEV